MTILEQLAEYAKERVTQAKKRISLQEMKKLAMEMPRGEFVFEKALQESELSFICECKKASPSKGIIVEEFPYVEIAKAYEEAGATCVSVLTEPKWFLGKDCYLKEIAQKVSIPCLRKDFVVDEYMIYEAKVLGASAVLLICAILTEEQVKKYIKVCDSLGISALVEVHNEREVEMAMLAGARMIGVNNRDLKDFTVTRDNSKRLRNLVPNSILYVAESGVRTRKDIEVLVELGADAVLIGETMMRATDKKSKLQELRGVLCPK